MPPSPVRTAVPGKINSGETYAFITEQFSPGSIPLNMFAQTMYKYNNSPGIFSRTGNQSSQYLSVLKLNTVLHSFFL